VTNKLFYGDNLDVLRRKIESGSIDLCYIDPPFNSKRNYFQIYNNQGSEDRAQAQAFVDTWTWEDEAEKALDYILDIERLHPRAGETRWTEQTIELIRGLEKVLGRGSLLAYLVHIAADRRNPPRAQRHRQLLSPLRPDRVALSQAGARRGVLRAGWGFFERDNLETHSLSRRGETLWADPRRSAVLFEVSGLQMESTIHGLHR
jgi:hypothetical protein